MEELLEEKNGPLDSHLKWPRLCADISCVHCKFKQLLLRIKLFLMSLPVNEQLSILAILDAFLLQKGLYLGQIGRVTGHVCRQNDAYKALSEGLVVIPREVLEKVILLSIEQKKGLCCMIVLLDTLITIANCAL